MVVKYQTILTDQIQNNIPPEQRRKAPQYAKDIIDWQVAVETQFKKQIKEIMEAATHDEPPE